jgi:HEAT repeat protein
MRNLRLLCTIALGACASKDDPRYWIDRLKDDDPKVVEEAVDQLGKLGKPEAVEPLCALWAKHPREEILTAILTLKDKPGFRKEQAVPTLIAALDFTEETYHAANVAAEALGNFKATAAVPALVAVLDKKLSLKSRANLTKLTAIQALGKIGGPEATDGLLRALERPAEEQDFPIAMAAALALGDIGDPKAVRPLIRGLFYTGRGLQMYANARVALVKIGPPAVPPLIDAHQRHDQDLEEVAKKLEFVPGILEFKTALALGELRDPRAIPALRATLKAPPIGDENEKSRSHNGAITGLGMIGGEEVVPDLVWALEKHPDWHMRAKAAEMLNIVGSRKALPNLLQMAKTGFFMQDGDKYNEVRWASALAFSKIAGPEGYAQLEPIVKATTPEQGRDIFDEALQRLQLPRDCKDDAACYAKALDDPVLAKEEAAAFQLARHPNGASQLGALAAKVGSREPVVRLAVLDAIDRLADTTKGCAECVTRLEEQIERDKRKTTKALGGDIVNEMRCTLARIQKR